jgi:hypothetical protein
MTSGIHPWWRQGARAAALAGLVWAAPWASSRALAQGPDAGAPLLAIPLPRTPPANQDRYLLTRSADGGYVYDDLRFVARVAPDGHVTFSDKHIRLETRVFGVLTQKYRRLGDGRPSLVQAIEQVMRNDPDRPVAPMAEVCQQRVDALLPGLAPCLLVETPISFALTVDFTDEVMRLTGNGWYRYEKAKFLSATFDLRARFAAERQARRLRDEIAELPSRLDTLWRDGAFTEREKRRIICLLWAEVQVEDHDASRAAGTVISWIKRRLPPGSAAAYSASEIAACAADGRRPFSPYDPD